MKYGEMMKHIIDCDADPFVPKGWKKGWKVEEHKKGGQFVFDPAKVKFYLSPNQQNGKGIEGNKLRKELADELVLNANVLDYLFKNPQLIPENWKKDEQGNPRYIFFWGTIYRDSGGDLCVSYLCFLDGSWDKYYYWLGGDWFGCSPAALRASH